MLDSFRVSHATDGKAVCRIYVEPHKRQCAVTVTIDRVIVCLADETDSSFRSATPADWQSISYWEAKASNIAKAWSPFWRGESAS